MSRSAQRVPAGAHYGLRDWMVQRVTALVILVFVLWVVGALLAGNVLFDLLFLL